MVNVQTDSNKHTHDEIVDIARNTYSMRRRGRVLSPSRRAAKTYRSCRDEDYNDRLRLSMSKGRRVFPTAVERSGVVFSSTDRAEILFGLNVCSEYHGISFGVRYIYSRVLNMAHCEQ